MDFSWTEEQTDCKNRTIAFARECLNKDVVQLESRSEFSKEDWVQCAAFGILGMVVPASYCGIDDDPDLLKATFAMEGLGYGCRDNGLPFALNAQMWTVQLPILKFGTEQQKEKYLKPMVKGQIIGCHALTEEKAGSDVFAMETTAEKVDGGYLLNGRKRYITLGPVADIALVFAKTNPKLGKWGVSGFIVENNFRGFHAGPNEEKMGMRTVPFGELVFENCFVPETNLLGSEGAGWSITLQTLEYDRCGILASQLGAMERQLEESVKFVKERKQFGTPIAKFQAVSNRIADMKLRLETSRLLLYKVVWLKKTGKSAMLDAALLKLNLSEGFVASSLDAIRNSGGMGYITANEIERDLRDAIGGIIYAGTSDIQRNVISELLGL